MIVVFLVLVFLLAAASGFYFLWTLWRWWRRPEARTPNLRNRMVASGILAFVLSSPILLLAADLILDELIPAFQTEILKAPRIVENYRFEEGDELDFYRGKLTGARLAGPRRMDGILVTGPIGFSRRDGKPYLMQGRLAADSMLFDTLCAADGAFEVRDNRLVQCILAEPKMRFGIEWPRGTRWYTGPTHGTQAVLDVGAEANPIVIPPSFDSDMEGPLRFERAYIIEMGGAEGSARLEIMSLDAPILYHGHRLRRLMINQNQTDEGVTLDGRAVKISAQP